MEVKSNQLIIQKVENGFILSLQEKGKTNFLGSNQIDKKHYVAETEKNLLKILESKIPLMVCNTTDEEEDNEDE